MKISLRNAHEEDITQLAVLSEQLGYPQEITEFKKHFELVNKNQNHRLLVAEAMVSERRFVVGAVLFRKNISLFTEPMLDIVGLVVDEAYRGHGIGKLFLNEAEKVCREWGYSKIFLSSNIKRERAHQFYLREGFIQMKTSYKFEKVIS